MIFKEGFIHSKIHCVVQRTGRGAVSSLVACMVLGLMFCPLVLAGEFDNATIASDGPAIGVDGVLGDAGPVHSFSHTIGGDANRILVVAAAAEGIGAAFDTVVTGITYDSVAMTAIGTAVADNGPGMLTALYYMLEADLPSAAGPYTVEVTYSTGPISLTSAAISLSEFVQQPPEAMATSAAPDNNGTTTANITTLSADAWLINAAGAGDFRADGGFASSSGMVTRVTEERGTQDLAFATKIIPVAGAQAITWTYVTPNRMSQVVAAFEAIPPPPPVFSILPVGGAREIGDSITFEVALFAPVGGVNYQWKKDGGNVGTDASTLALTNLQLADSGQYSVVVTDGSLGSPYTTPEVTLTVVDELPVANLWALIVLAALLLVSGAYFAKRRLARN